MATVTITIDGREVQAEEGQNLIEAARKIGVLIPHFCYHPGLGIDGNCRMCLIELEGVPKPQIACNTFVKEGMKVITASPRVKQLQASVLEFLFLNHPLDCPICDQSGECYLQDYYMAHGQYQSRLDTPKVHKRKVVEVGPRVVLDAERCVLCTRCVRFCDDVTGTGELYIVNRGNRSELTHYPGVPLANDYSLNTVDICPVGALTSRQFRFRKRVWYLSTVNSICTGCARGCNIYLEHNEGTVYRYRPRENMEVNRYWMCDYGRETYHPLNVDRLEVPMRGGEEEPYSRAFAEAAGWIRSAREVGGGQVAGATPGRGGAAGFVLVSPASSTETLFAAKRFAREVLGGVRILGTGTRPPLVQDEILRRSDPYPNSEGLRMLSLEGDPEPELRKGGRLLVVIEDDPLGETQRPSWKDLFSKFDTVLYLGTNENATSLAAHLALPITPHSECEGTFVNFQGRVQRFRKGVTPAGDSLWAPALLQRLAAEVGIQWGWRTLNALWSDLAAGEPAFARVDPAMLGGVGIDSRAPKSGAGEGTMMGAAAEDSRPVESEGR